MLKPCSVPKIEAGPVAVDSENPPTPTADCFLEKHGVATPHHLLPRFIEELIHSLEHSKGFATELVHFGNELASSEFAMVMDPNIERPTSNTQHRMDATMHSNPVTDLMGILKV